MIVLYVDNCVIVANNKHLAFGENIDTSHEAYRQFEISSLSSSFLFTFYTIIIYIMIKW